MGVRAQRIRSEAADDRYGADRAEEPVLQPNEVLERLETSGYVDDDIGAARGFVNGAIAGAVVWALVAVTYSVLG